jgi:hypothetical protein
LRVAGQSLIFFVNLPGIAANADIDAIAVEGLMTKRCRRTRAIVVTAWACVAHAVAAIMSAAGMPTATVTTSAMMTTTRTAIVVRTLTLPHEITRSLG